MASRSPPSDELGEEEKTVVDEHPERFDSPVTIPRCILCGRVVFFDSFTDAASLVAMSLFSEDRCVRSQDGRMQWCGEMGELRYRPPR